MKKLTIIIVLAMLCLNFNSYSQAKTPMFKPIKIGEVIPEEIWNYKLSTINLPGNKKAVTLNDYKGKLIILDFWDTYCGTCIGSLPRLHELTKLFKDQVAILPVTDQSESVVIPFIKKSNKLKALNLLSVTSDSLLSKIFPHRLIPHLVWITPDRKLYATTNSGDVNQGTIAKVLKAEDPHLIYKKDINTDKPLFLNDSLPADVKLQRYSLFIKGLVNGLPSWGKERMENGKICGSSYMNQPLQNVFTGLGSELIPGFNDKRLQIDTDKEDKLNKDRAHLIPSDYYTFEYTNTEGNTTHFYEDMLLELGQATGYHARIEKQVKDCLILIRLAEKRKKSVKKTVSFDSKIYALKEEPVSFLLNRFNTFDDFKGPEVIDGTGSDQKISVQIKAPFSDLPAIRKELNLYGFDLLPAKRNLDMLVISKRDL